MQFLLGDFLSQKADLLLTIKYIIFISWNPGSYWCCMSWNKYSSGVYATFIEKLGEFLIFKLFFKIFYLFILERGKEGEREREKH